MHKIDHQIVHKNSPLLSIFMQHPIVAAHTLVKVSDV